MPLDEKFSYVARLLRSLALDDGVSAEFGGARTRVVGEASPVSAAALLRDLNDISVLNDISWMPSAASSRGEVTTMTCTYCGREIDSLLDETYRAIEGWETIDGRTDLKWRLLDSFACRSCVDEHFVAFGGGDDDEN